MGRIYDQGGPTIANPAFHQNKNQFSMGGGGIGGFRSSSSSTSGSGGSSARGMASRGTAFGHGRGVAFGGAASALLTAMDAGDVKPGAVAERRFLSISNGSLFMAGYFSLQPDGGFVECTPSKRSTSSEKLCDLLKCKVGRSVVQVVGMSRIITA